MESKTGKDRKVFDVNTLAIFLVDDHPGNRYVSPIVRDGLRGVYIPIMMDILPIRAFWVMTRKWGCPKEESAEAIEHFVKAYDRAQYSCLQKQAILESFKLAKQLKHDVYDCVYIAFALQESASAIITTDTDFELLCQKARLDYINPVPKEVLSQFKEENE